MARRGERVGKGQDILRLVLVLLLILGTYVLKRVKITVKRQQVPRGACVHDNVIFYYFIGLYIYI